MKKKLYQQSIELTNGPLTSGLVKKFAESPISRKFVPGYIKTYKIDTNDIENPLTSFPTLHDFFIRTLKPESRPIADAEIVSPVDAQIEIVGDLHEGIQFLVKGQRYSLADLLGNKALADRYRGGKYIVLYLSPADYHRIHSPANGKIVKQYILGKKSYPVNGWGLKFGKSPLSGNYRLISELETEFGHMLSVKVGAMFVNSIRLTNLSDQWAKGEEVAYFSFGSTVVLFFEKDSIEFYGNVSAGKRIYMGEALAYMV
ncbi:phosphatidylserine decarboxylase [Planococcus ruber]|uniref:phosphatidylserine decarboxylase n=1 Tax=Planococcus ruber TaxID=2027871 RepID=UPI001FED4C52|nr:phosphatidylserine decarboxylase [Planococcus ruber]